MRALAQAPEDPRAETAGVDSEQTVIQLSEQVASPAESVGLSAAARVLLRPVYGSQGSAFAAALPIGLVLPRHLRVPAEIRESL